MSQTEEPEAYDPGPLLEGMARCTFSEGMNLKTGEVVYIREIPNMRGHCVILRNHRPPLVGYHTDRFEMLTPEDDACREGAGNLRPLGWEKVESLEDCLNFCTVLHQDYLENQREWGNDSLLSFLEATRAILATWEDPDFQLGSVDIQAFPQPRPGEEPQRSQRTRRPSSDAQILLDCPQD